MLSPEQLLDKVLAYMVNEGKFESIRDIRAGIIQTDGQIISEADLLLQLDKLRLDGYIERDKVAVTSNTYNVYKAKYSATMFLTNGGYSGERQSELEEMEWQKEKRYYEREKQKWDAGKDKRDRKDFNLKIAVAILTAIGLFLGYMNYKANTEKKDSDSQVKEFRSKLADEITESERIKVQLKNELESKRQLDSIIQKMDNRIKSTDSVIILMIDTIHKLSKPTSNVEPNPGDGTEPNRRNSKK